MKTVMEASNLNSIAVSKEQVNRVGQTIVEAMKNNGQLDKLAESLGVAKESLDVTQTALFSTAVAGFIEKRLRPELVAAGLIKKISGFDTKGYNGLKIPLRSALITAADLPDSGQLSYDSGTYGSTTITLSYKYAANSITHEIMKFANVDLIAEELGEIGDAIGRKIDSDIIAAFAAATTTANGNRTYLGATATITFTALIAGQASAFANYAKPDAVLLNHSTLATLMGLVQITGGTNAPGALTMQGANGAAFPMLRDILGMKVVASQQVDADHVFLIDTARTGYYVESGDVEVFDGRRTGYLAYEVIGAKCYGVGIVQPKSLYLIEENAAS